MVRVKICGIKRKEDALASINYGADAIGILIGQKHTSDDFIDEELAKQIVQSLPPFCSTVMVTHLTDVDTITRLASHIGVTTIQLHGESSPQDAREIQYVLPYIKVYKAIHVIDDTSISSVQKFIDHVDAILLDTANNSTGQVGGTGITHDWTISKKIVESYSIPVILAGGLKPENIEEAIKTVNPFGVDVNSGTKGSDGYKDSLKLKAFIENSKRL